VLVAGGASGSALLVLAAAGLAVVLMRRGQRRRRLTTGSPDERITGAWYEFTDALRLDGRPAPRHLDATEVAAFAVAPAARRSLLRRATPPGPVDEPSSPDELRTQRPLPPLDDLVAGLNTMAFAPGAAGDAQAERAGAQAVAFGDALRDRRSWWRRAWWQVHPGPLRWHRLRASPQPAPTPMPVTPQEPAESAWSPPARRS
jgi:hypothetical protein